MQTRAEPIDPDRIYSKEQFEAATGIGPAGQRKLRREGMPVRYLSGRLFIAGRDFIRHALEHGKTEKDA
jgi:hypothetical protein